MIPMGIETITLVLLAPHSYQLSHTGQHHIFLSLVCLSQVLVTVLDVNDFRPRFSDQVFETSVFENEPSGTSVITLTANDLDEGENGLLYYSLQGPGAGRSHTNTHTHHHRYCKRLLFQPSFNTTGLTYYGLHWQLIS